MGAFDVSRRCDYGHSVFMRGTPTDVKKTDLEQVYFVILQYACMYKGLYILQNVSNKDYIVL